MNTGSSGRYNNGLYLVDDRVAFSDNIRFSWLVSNQATMYNGALSFAIRFICSTDGSFDYVWSTAIYNSIQVGKGMDNAQSIVTQYADLIGHFYNQFVATGNETLNKLDKRLQEEINNISANEIIPAINAAIEAKKVEVMNYIHSQADETVNEVLIRLPTAEGVSF
jgi:hypothetical protein